MIMRAIFWWLAVFLSGAAYADDTTQALFAGTEPIAIVLEGPFKQLAGDEDADPPYRPATLIWKDASGTDVRIPLEIKPRGKSRRKDIACQFPPLRLNFPENGPPGTPFSGLDKVKLVTHCGMLGASNPAFAARVELELLLYRVFNRISPTSLRVRPLDITYVDSDRGGDRSEHGGFLIEPEAMLAARLQTEPAEVTAINRDQLEPVQANLVEVFQFLIGNTDFSMIRGPEGDRCCHNIVLLAAPDGRFVPVPYDFDATGIVDAPYARPVEGLGIDKVRHRLYRGYCRPTPALDATLVVFRAARADIYALFRDDARLERHTVDRTIDYLDAFYAIIDQPEALQKKLASHCI